MSEGKSTGIPTIQEELSESKSLFEDEKTVVSESKPLFEAIVSSMSCKDRVKNNIRKLYENVGDDIFSRADIMNILELSETSSGDLIKRLDDNDLIEPVKGQGKGKYRFH